MSKFLTSLDEHLVRSEAALEGLDMDEYLKARRGTESGLKDFRKAQNAKSNWRKNRHKLKKGIKRFHKSTDGKRFHRELNRFNATRAHKSESVIDGLVALQSAKTHLLIEKRYTMPMIEQVEYDLFFDEAMPILDSAITKVQEGRELDLDESQLILDLAELDPELSQ